MSPIFQPPSSLLMARSPVPRIRATYFKFLYGNTPCLSIRFCTFQLFGITAVKSHELTKTSISFLMFHRGSGWMDAATEALLGLALWLLLEGLGWGWSLYVEHTIFQTNILKSKRLSQCLEFNLKLLTVYSIVISVHIPMTRENCLAIFKTNGDGRKIYTPHNRKQASPMAMSWKTQTDTRKGYIV